MSYYFPFGGSSTTSIQTVSHSILATTASVPLSSTITALTASFASTVQITPSAGTNGTSKTLADCGTSTIEGPKGVKGPTGSKGTDNTTCPQGTIECPLLFTSLSMVLPGFPNGINAARPSGSQFSKVCMEIPIGCTSANAECPPFLPTASISSTYPSIP